MTAASDAQSRVFLHVWGISRRHRAQAILLVAFNRFRLRRVHGLRFFKLLGTGNGTTFTLRDADVGHWGLLSVWDHPTHSEKFAEHPVMKAWRRIAHEELVVDLIPLSVSGQWARRQPFDLPPLPRSTAAHGPIAAITRARIKPRFWRRFARSVPAVAADLHSNPGVLFTLGIGEAPIGLLGTFSVWRDMSALNDFAYRRSPHQQVIRRTHELQWYAEELFARFEVARLRGHYRGRAVTLSESQ